MKELRTYHGDDAARAGFFALLWLVLREMRRSEEPVSESVVNHGRSR